MDEMCDVVAKDIRRFGEERLEGNGKKFYYRKDIRKYSTPGCTTILLVNLPRIEVISVQINLTNLYAKLQVLCYICASNLFIRNYISVHQTFEKIQFLVQGNLKFFLNWIKVLPVLVQKIFSELLKSRINLCVKVKNLL